MIVDAIIALGRVIVLALLDLLPEASDTLNLPTSSGLTATISNYLGPFDNIAPVHEAVSAIWFVVVVLFPPLFVYLIVTWAYGWLPFIGKKG